MGNTTPLIMGLSYNEPNSLHMVFKRNVSIVTVTFHSLALFPLQFVLQCQPIQVLQEMKNSLGFWNFFFSQPPAQHLTGLKAFKTFEINGSFLKGLVGFTVSPFFAIQRKTRKERALLSSLHFSPQGHVPAAGRAGGLSFPGQ